MFRCVMFGLIAAATLAGGNAAAAPADELETLARTGPWDINYDDDSCSLFAQFGTGDREVIARMTRFQPGDEFDLTLFGKRFDGIPSRDSARIDFGLGAAVKRDAIPGKSAKMPLVIFNSVRLDGWDRNSKSDEWHPITPAQEDMVTGATIAIPGMRKFRLSFVSLGKALVVLRGCEGDLLRRWGFDPEVQYKLSRRAMPLESPRHWLSPEDYPSAAVAMGINALVQFRLDVDERGAVANCHILYRTDPDVFAKTTCNALSRRAKFTPALDAAGTPVRSFYINKVNWRAGS